MTEPARSSAPPAPLPQPPPAEASAPTQPPDPALSARARLRRAYGWLLARLFAWAFVPVRYPEEGARELRGLSERGVVVHVARSAALVTFLYFQHLLVRLGLPPAQAVAGLGAKIWRPWGRLVAGRRRVRAPLRDDVAAAVKARRSALVFLRRPGTLGSALAYGGLRDPFPGLVAAQRSLERPIFLVPQLLVWERTPPNLRKSLFDALFGEPESPGFWRSLFSLFWNRKRAFVKVGKPVDLLELVRASPELDDATLGRQLRSRLHLDLAREARVVTGPRLKPARRLQMETLRDRDLRATLVEVARERGRADGSVEREAAKDLDEIAARYSHRVVGVFKWLLDWVFERIYDGVEVDEAGLARVAKVAATAPIAICPSHKSYIDFLIINYVFFSRGMVSPHIAAGINFAFWPLGPFFRRCGAFFIRRSFKGDRVYSAVLKAYVRKLVRDGFPVEFFVEGARSRSGKVLLPRFGMLSMQVDAWVDGVRDDVAFCPAWIGYSKLVEAGAHAKELGGEDKRQESIGGLLKAPKVLVSRYGRIQLRFAEPVSLAALAAERGFDRRSHTEEQKRALVRALGFRVVDGINRATELMPTALLSTALLSHDKRGLAAPELVDRMEFLLARAASRGALLGVGMEPGALDPRQPGPMAEAVSLLSRDGALKVHETGGEHIYAVPEDERITLDYHKNTTLHFLAPDAIMATALLTAPSPRRAVVEARARALSRALKHEFIYPDGGAQAFARTLERLAGLGLVAEVDGELRPTEGGAPRLRLLADLVVNYVEGMAAATEALALLLDGPRDAKEWTKLALERARASYLAGRLRRRESLSKAIFENAVALFEEQGVVVREGEKGKARALAPAMRTREALDERLAEARSFLVPTQG